METPTLTEFKVRYRHAVFTAQRLLSMAEEARVSGMQKVHDLLVDAANEYVQSYVRIRVEAYKAFPDEAADALTFDTTTTASANPDKPSA